MRSNSGEGWAGRRGKIFMAPKLTVGEIREFKDSRLLRDETGRTLQGQRAAIPPRQAISPSEADEFLRHAPILAPVAPAVYADCGQLWAAADQVAPAIGCPSADWLKPRGGSTGTWRPLRPLPWRRHSFSRIASHQPRGRVALQRQGWGCREKRPFFLHLTMPAWALFGVL